ncbi:NUDIX hydrolase [Thiolapillus sp.]|uniref:NUDIX domain-containing protein n=2 Tax=Thiolapillus TaxID=1608298 RepID=A0A831RWK5_9GAMM|nr:NUDIX hydrolase [Thiolapillus sp.]HEC06299.1 NUDIX domain-containing protein [Thiolapillus brandeum]
MKFCSSCGSNVELSIPPGDNRQRFVCTSCGEIHYQNPKLVTGCIPEWKDRVLLCRRAIEPRYGLWTLPAGFMENEESAQQGAARETLEEANARVSIEQLYTTFNLPHISQVYLLFRGSLEDLDFSPGSESLDVALFREEDIPWDELAFPVVRETLKYYFQDRESGVFIPRVGDIHWQSRKSGEYTVTLLQAGS